MQRAKELGKGSKGQALIFAVVTVLAAGLIDQGTKLVVQTLLPTDVAIEIGRIFRIEHVRNSGFALSLLSGTGRLPLVVTFVSTLVIIGLWLRNTDGGRFVSLGFALALGGMLGNLVDRLRFGEVFDFVVLHVGEHNWFAANLADAEIVLGFLLLISALPAKANSGSSALDQPVARTTKDDDP